jgi:integrase
MRFYNNPQFNEIKIHYCPFDNYKIVNAPITRKRNIKIDQIKEIRDSQAIPDSRAELARDMFMLSFYLCGMNAVDIYNLRVENIVDGRVEYNRSKTRGRRKDDAFISIKIVKDAQPILEKYIGKLHLRYSDFLNLDRALNIGLKRLSDTNNVSNVTFYWARHSFGNIARNKCRMSKDDVALALNHTDNYHKITDIYLEKDWNIIDDVQDSVVNLLSF